MIEFGGWGIRTRPGKRAWTVRGSEAVRLTFQEGPSLYLGTPNPQRLKERIDLALDRLVAAGSAGLASPGGEKE